jgi:hypothetical protein
VCRQSRAAAARDVPEGPDQTGSGSAPRTGKRAALLRKVKSMGGSSKKNVYDLTGAQLVVACLHWHAGMGSCWPHCPELQQHDLDMTSRVRLVHAPAGQTGSFLNMAPEVVLGKQYDEKCGMSTLYLRAASIMNMPVAVPGSCSNSK